MVGEEVVGEEVVGLRMADGAVLGAVEGDSVGVVVAAQEGIKRVTGLVTIVYDKDVIIMTVTAMAAITKFLEEGGSS